MWGYTCCFLVRTAQDAGLQKERSFMLERFYPDHEADTAADVPYEKLYEKGFRGVIFDIDNTLVPHGAPADEKAVALFQRLDSLGFRTLLLSNNKEPRVKMFADAVHASYIYKAGKPGVKGYRLAMEKMGTTPENTVFVGDQLFTDIWGAKKAGIDTYLVKPIHPKEEIQIVLKRYLERIVLYFYHRKMRNKTGPIIDGHTRTCGLIGNPVEHTKSPLIHNGLAELTGSNLTYVPFLVAEAEKLKEAVDGAFALNVVGMNVTVPYKEKIMPYLKDVESLAAKIGAVNTLVRVEDGYAGYNTDMPGLYRAMVSDGIRIDGEDVILIGAGGVARAVAVMLAERAHHVYILNRTVEKAEAIAAEVNTYAGYEVATAKSIADYRTLPVKKYLAIQATNVGMHPHTEHAAIEEDDFYRMIHTGYDLIYNPEETRFMKKVKEQGGRAFNGLKMLLYQGIIAYELWNKTEITKEQAEEIYKRLKDA